MNQRRGVVTFFFASRRRHTRLQGDWSSDVCSSDLIVGQNAAKRAVAIALRNRWRRQQVPDELREEIYPKNIIMIGPTGVGKTEIARQIGRASCRERV